MAYGFMTHSHLNSTEHRQTKRDRKEATKQYLAKVAEKPVEVTVGPFCNCRSFRLPHALEAHKTLQSEYDWTPWEERYVLDKEHNCYVLRVQRFKEKIR
jgi:hypothetical protein